MLSWPPRPVPYAAAFDTVWFIVSFALNIDSMRATKATINIKQIKFCISFLVTAVVGLLVSARLFNIFTSSYCVPSAMYAHGFQNYAQKTRCFGENSTKICLY